MREKMRKIQEQVAKIQEGIVVKKPEVKPEDSVRNVIQFSLSSFKFENFTSGNPNQICEFMSKCPVQTSISGFPFNQNYIITVNIVF